jgi:membrane protease YdiL (CAAX protease family)
MRIASGIILIILGVFGLRGLFFLLRESMIRVSYIPFSAVFTIIWYIVPVVLFVSGGIFCLRKKYWRVCLAAASFAVFMAIVTVVEPSVVLGRLVMPWIAWFVVIGAVISTVFISLSKKEWQEISNSVDGKVPYDG